MANMCLLLVTARVTTRTGLGRYCWGGSMHGHTRWGTACNVRIKPPLPSRPVLDIGIHILAYTDIIVTASAPFFFQRCPTQHVPFQPVVELSGFTQQWSANFVELSSESNHFRRRRDTCIGNRAVVARGHSGLQCFSCDGTTCSHRATVAAYLNIRQNEPSERQFPVLDDGVALVVICVRLCS